MMFATGISWTWFRRGVELCDDLPAKGTSWHEASRWRAGQGLVGEYILWLGLVASLTCLSGTPCRGSSLLVSLRCFLRRVLQ